MTDNSNTFFLLRHGQATSNVSGLIASADEETRNNPSRLTELGIKQAKIAAEKLLGESIDFIYSSPFKRTMETASIVAERLGLDIKTDKRLSEVNVGVFSGLTVEEYGDYFDGKNRLTTAPNSGESLMDIRARVKDFLDYLNSQHKNKNILIVGHGDVLWMMMSILSGVEGDEILKTPYIENGEIKKFS